MNRPRALVVRSGALPGIAFPRPPESANLDLIEKMSHSVERLTPDVTLLQEPMNLAIFTSQNAARVLLADPALVALFRRSIAGGRVAAIGEATAATLRENGVEPDIVAAGSGTSVLERLPARLDGWRILLPRAEDATEDLPENLVRRGARLAPLIIYRKNPVPRDPSFDREIVDRPFAAFATTSPSAASWLLAGANSAALQRLRETPAVVLGRFTQRYLESHGVRRVEIARDPSFPSVLERLEELAAARQPA